MAEPILLTGFELPLDLQKIEDEEQCLLHESGPQDENRVIVFVTLPVFDLLSLSVNWFYDGTFSTASNVFYQIYPKTLQLKDFALLLLTLCYPTKRNQLTFTSSVF